MKKFKSKFEARIFPEVQKYLKEKSDKQPINFEYETTSFPYILQKNYTPDWPVTRPDGSVLYIESKGLFDLDSRTKMLAVKNQHPDLEFVLLFQRDNTYGRAKKEKKRRYSDWAQHHGFDYAVNCVPFRWLYGTKCPKKLITEGIIIDPTAKFDLGL